MSIRPPGGKACGIVDALSKEHNTWLSTNYDGDIRFSARYFNTVEEVDGAFAQIDTHVRMR